MKKPKYTEEITFNIGSTAKQSKLLEQLRAGAKLPNTVIKDDGVWFINEDDIEAVEYEADGVTVKNMIFKEGADIKHSSDIGKV